MDNTSNIFISAAALSNHQHQFIKTPGAAVTSFQKHANNSSDWGTQSVLGVKFPFASSKNPLLLKKRLIKDIVPERQTGRRL